MVLILHRYYVSPPIDQYLKFKNHCSLMAMLTLVANLPLVSITPALTVAKVTAGVIDTVGKFATGVVDTGVVDAGGAPSLKNLK
jgi:hypothetical protein